MGSRSRNRDRGGRRGGRSSFGLLIGISVGALVIVVGLIVFSLVSNRVGGGEPAIYADFEQEIVTETPNGQAGPGAVGFAIGDPEAPVTVFDYSDFSCPACGQLSPEIDRVIDTYVRDGDVRVIYKTITFVNPPTSEPAAAAGYCAGQQGYFWEMHDQLWDLFSTNGANAYTPVLLGREAGQIEGMNVQQFNACLNSPATVEAINGVLEEAAVLGINATPTVFVNGQRVGFTSSYGADLDEAIEAALGGR